MWPGARVELRWPASCHHMTHCLVPRNEGDPCDHLGKTYRQHNTSLWNHSFQNVLSFHVARIRRRDLSHLWPIVEGNIRPADCHHLYLHQNLTEEKILWIKNCSFTTKYLFTGPKFWPPRKVRSGSGFTPQSTYLHLIIARHGNRFWGQGVAGARCCLSKGQHCGRSRHFCL